jgi:hypothetical protein
VEVRVSKDSFKEGKEEKMDRGLELSDSACLDMRLVDPHQPCHCRCRAYRTGATFLAHRKEGKCVEGEEGKKRDCSLLTLIAVS